jgi:hypothetical protein
LIIINRAHDNFIYFKTGSPAISVTNYLVWSVQKTLQRSNYTSSLVATTANHFAHLKTGSPAISNDQFSGLVGTESAPENNHTSSLVAATPLYWW